MKTVNLGDLVSPALVQRAGDIEYPMLSMTMHDGLVAQANRFKKRIASLDTSSYKVVQRGQLVVGFPINEGVLDFQLHHAAAVVSPAYGVWNLRDESLADRTYLKRFLKSPRAIAYYVGKMKGSTARRRSLPSAEFNAMPVPLPPLPEQRRIAAILDHADALRAKRRQVLTHLDALTQSIFHEMLGSVTSERVPIGSFADVRTGSTPSRKHPDNFGGSIPWVKTTEVQGGVILATSESVTEQGAKSARLKVFPIGSVVVAMYGQGKTRGQTAILGVPAATNQACAVVTPNDSFDPTFLQGQLAASYDRLRGEAEGGNQPNLSIARVSGFEVLLPSIDLQRKYTSRVDRINAHRASVQNANTADDELFASLQSRAFRGELWP